MVELQLGFISDEEMADWCGKKLKTYKNARTRWAKTVLVRYAEFELVKGGVNITKIIDPIFSSSLKKEVGQKWHDYWGYNNALDTNTDCWKKLKFNLTNEVRNDNTGKTYVSYWKCADYGIARKNKRRRGTKGECRYIYCAIIRGKAKYFSPEDYQKKSELEDKYLNTTYKEQKYEMRAVYADYKRGEITKQEYEESLNDLTELDLGWYEFETAFNTYLQEAYQDPTAHADFRQELTELAF